MFRLCIFVLFCLFSQNSIASEWSSSEPNAVNWRKFSPKTCVVRSRDPLGLRPVIFPSKQETYVETLSPQPSTEFVVIPHYKRKDGTVRTARIGERVIPDMRHPRTMLRRDAQQQIGFLNENDVLVDEAGELITQANPIQNYSTEVTMTFKSGVKEEVIWERSIENNPTTIDVIEKHTKQIAQAENCSYLIAIPRGKRMLQRKRIAVKNGMYVCGENGGYKFSAPEIIDRYEVRGVEMGSNESTLFLKDHKGHVNVGKISKISTMFNALSESKKCVWKGGSVKVSRPVEATK